MRRRCLAAAACLSWAACGSQARLADLDVGGSALLVEPANVAANGADGAVVQLHLAATDGRPWSATEVRLLAAGCETSPQGLLTDASGNANFQVRCAAEQVVSLAARVRVAGLEQPVPVAADVDFYRPTDGARAVAPGALLAMQLVARGADGAPARQYIGRAVFSSSDPEALLPAPRTLGAVDGGVAMVTDGMALLTPGWQSITATDAQGQVLGALELLVSRGGSLVAFDRPALAAVAGQACEVGLQGVSEDGRLDAGFVHQALLRSSDPAATLPQAYSFVAADRGRHQLTDVVFRTAGAQTLTAVDQASGRQVTLPVTVSAAAAARVEVSGPASAVAGQPLALVLRIQDAFGNAAAPPSGAVALSCDDPAAQTAPRVAWDSPPPPAGIHVDAALTPRRAGLTRLFAGGEGGAAGLAGEARVQVAAAPLAALGLELPPQATAGDLVTLVVTAQDLYGNVVSDFAGAITLSADRPRAIVPPLLLMTGADFGRRSLSRGARLVDAGTTHISAAVAARPAVAGTATTQVAPAAAYSLGVGAAPAAVAGAPTDLEISVLDRFGNRQTDFIGSVTLAASDPAATLPGGGTIALGAADNGRRLLPGGLVWRTAGAPQRLQASSGALTGQSAGVTVAPGPLDSFRLDGLPVSTVRTQPLSPTLRALDAFGNTVTGYTGTVALSADLSATLPATVALGAGDHGARTLTHQVSVDVVGVAQLTASDGVVTGSQAIGVTHGCFTYGDLPVAPDAFEYNCKPIFALDTSDRPTLVYISADGGFGLFTLAWDGDAWQPLGPQPFRYTPDFGHSDGGGARGMVRLDGAGRASLSFTNLAGNKLFFARHQAGAWAGLGGSDTVPIVGSAYSDTASPSVGPQAAMALGPGGQPWLAYAQSTPGDGTDLTVRAWQGASWDIMGAGASLGLAGKNTRPVLEFDGGGTPWLAWVSTASGTAQVTVSQGAAAAGGGAWAAAGGGPAVGDNVSQSAGSVGFPAMAIGPDHHPVLVWSDDASGVAQIYARRWDGAAWSALGSSVGGGGISGSTRPRGARFPDVAIGPDGQPRVVWTEPDEGFVYMRYFDGTAWQEVNGSASGAGMGIADFPTVAVDSQGRVVTVVLHREGAGNVVVCSWR